MMDSILNELLLCVSIFNHIQKKILPFLEKEELPYDLTAEGIDIVFVGVFIHSDSTRRSFSFFAIPSMWRTRRPLCPCMSKHASTSKWVTIVMRSTTLSKTRIGSTWRLLYSSFRYELRTSSITSSITCTTRHWVTWMKQNTSFT